MIEVDGTAEPSLLIRRRARRPRLEIDRVDLQPTQTTEETLLVIVRRTYTPKPGGGGLQQNLRELQGATVEADFPPLSVYRKVLGLHGTMVTVQRWDSVAAYDASRNFERIYPALASTHETELYEEIV